MLPSTHVDRNCTCYTQGVVEDPNHTLWGCEKASIIWAWVTHLVKLMEKDDTPNPSILVTQALIGEPLDFFVPYKWWATIRATTI